MTEAGAGPEAGGILAEVQAVLLDLDGTLVRLDAPWAELRDRLAGFLEPEVLPTGPKRPTTETLRDLRAADRHDDVARVLELLREAELRGLEGSRVVPRGEDVLRAAVERGLPVAVVSNNCQATVEAALERHGLRSAAKLAMGLAASPHPKPRPEGLREALDRLGVAPGDALFVGNDWKDFEAGRRAGIRTVDVASYERV